MQFFAVRSEAIARTHQALQALSLQGATSGSGPSRALRVAQLYGHLQVRSADSGQLTLVLSELAAQWHLQPRQLRADLEALQAMGWLSYAGTSRGTDIQLHEPTSLSRSGSSKGPGASNPAAATHQPAQPGSSELLERVAEHYNHHKPTSWPAYRARGQALLPKLQCAIRHAGDLDRFLGRLAQALAAMPAFWRTTYPQGRSGAECLAVLLACDRSCAGLGVEFWHVFSWGATGSKNAASAASGQGSSVESDPDFRRACRLFVWGDHAWRGQGMEAFELTDREKQRLTELLEAAGLGSPGQAAKQFAPSTNS